MCSSDLYHYPGWWESNSTIGFITNNDALAKLPKMYKEALTSATQEANMWAMSKYDAVNTPALKRLVGAGAALTPFSPEVMDACYGAANELYTEINAKNPAFKKLYDHYTAFLKESYTWTQVADYTMDSYMLRYLNAPK